MQHEADSVRVLLMERGKRSYEGMAHVKRVWEKVTSLSPFGYQRSPDGQVPVGDLRTYLMDEERAWESSPQLLPDDETVRRALAHFTEHFQQLFAIAIASGSGALFYKLIDTWAGLRKGRKLKIKVGDIEVEATQMKAADVLRIFELLEEKADRKKIREVLLEARPQPPARRRGTE